MANTFNAQSVKKDLAALISAVRHQEAGSAQPQLWQVNFASACTTCTRTRDIFKLLKAGVQRKYRLVTTSPALRPQNRRHFC